MVRILSFFNSTLEQSNVLVLEEVRGVPYRIMEPVLAR